MNNEELYNFLKKIDVLPAEQLDRLVSDSKNSGVMLEDLIFSKNIFSDAELLKIKSILSGFPKADLHKKVVSLEALSNIPENISREHGVVCFLENTDGIHVACYDTNTPEKILGYLPEDKKKVFYIETAENIKKVLSDYQKSSSEELGFRISNLSKKAKKVSSYGTDNFVKFFPDDYLSEIADDVYTKRIIDLVLEDAMLKNCDSVSIVGEHQKTTIKYRVGSKNISTAILDSDIIYPIVLNIKKQADLNISKETNFEDGYFIFKTKSGENVFVMFNILKTFSGYRVSLNISKQSDEMSDAIESMIPSLTQTENLYKKLSEGKGLFVFSGSSKTGKTRAFYNLIKMLQRKNLDIISVEKSPELRIFGISQLVSGSSSSVFSKLIGKALNQNPDVLAVSNLYKNDLVKVLNQASTGKVVLAEQDKDFGKLFSDLKNLSFSNETLDRVVSAAICHETFTSYEGLEKVNLSKREISLLTKIIPEGEIMEELKSAGAIDKRLSKLKDVSFFEKTRKSKKLSRDIYVRGVLDVKETVSFDKDTARSVGQKRKRVILENALILCAYGKVNIKEILKFVK